MRELVKRQLLIEKHIDFRYVLVDDLEKTKQAMISECPLTSKETELFSLISAELRYRRWSELLRPFGLVLDKETFIFRKK